MPVNARVMFHASPPTFPRPRLSWLLALVAALSGSVAPVAAQRVLGTPVAERPASAESDFSPGDAVRVTIPEEPELSGEFKVDQNLNLDLQRLGTMSLAGMSRAEATSAIEQRVRRVVRAPGNITVQPLIRIAVLGSVGKPGFYQYPATTSLPDALTEAGGPSGNADLERVSIERGNRRIIERDKATIAITQGRSLDQLGLRSGDRIEVGERSRQNWFQNLRTVAYGIGAIVTLVTLGTQIF